MKLSVDLEMVCRLREMGGIDDPQPVRVGLLCEEAGADELSFRIHREDEFQVVRDVEMMRELTQCSVALRVSPHGELLKLAFESKPDRVVLVPERTTGATVDSGFDLGQSRETLKKAISTLRDAEIPVSVFIDADIDQVRASHRMELSSVDLDIRRVTSAQSEGLRRAELQRVMDALRAASKLGIEVSVSGGVRYSDLLMLSRMTELSGVQMGHALIARGLSTGVAEATRLALTRLDGRST